jgi:acetylornithine deacetylase
VQSLDILARLIAFDTTSRNSNMELMRYVSDLFTKSGLKPLLVPNAEGTKANLFVTAGPNVAGGVMLSGHTDVVPVDGQDWTLPPFALTQRDGRLWGRGTADMKGFVACAIESMLMASRRPLASPLHLALSYDEEIGCIGVRSLIDTLARAPFQPRLCIIGEPTSMAVATGHKGKTALQAQCIGQEGHTAFAPNFVNAIHLACDLGTIIRQQQARLQAEGGHDPDYDIPYTTLHIGRISGGEGRNIVPNRCDLTYEIRNLASDDPADIMAEIQRQTDTLVATAKSRSPVADILIRTTNTYPGLSTPPDAQAVQFVKSLTGANSTIKVAFGTEGGLFQQGLGVQTVICGPGSMEQGHRPDEFITRSQFDQCRAMLATLLDRLG